MLSVAEALNFLLAAVRPVTGTDLVPTMEANGRVLAQTQSSLLHVPPMDNTQMDGYAVRSADCVSASARLRVPSVRLPARSPTASSRNRIATGGWCARCGRTCVSGAAYA